MKVIPDLLSPNLHFSQFSGMILFPEPQLKIPVQFFTSHWMWALYMFLFTVLFYLFYAQYRKRKREWELLQISGQQIQMILLKQQITPHFIFNSLSAVRGLILNNQQERAEHYILHMSKLLRSILESMDEKMISLAREIEMMEAYIKLESFKFNREIEFTCTSDFSGDWKYTKVPSMIFQPLLENAIQQGLYDPDKNPVRIHLRLTRKEKYIQSELEDFNPEVKGSAPSQEKRKKIGIANTRKRLELMLPSSERKKALVLHKKTEGAGMLACLKIPWEYEKQQRFEL